MHRVVALVRPVQSTFELGCAYEVFGTPRPGLPQYYEFEVCAETPGSIPTTAGYTISVFRDLTALESADTVIIPGWLPVETPLPDRVRRALLGAHARGARLVTICSGVFALARTGLLDGRSATTHPARAEQLRREFPRVRVAPDRTFVDHGDVATSAGAGAGIELCLHLVAKDHGADYAARLARHMVLPPPHDGGRGWQAPSHENGQARHTPAHESDRVRHVPSRPAQRTLDDLRHWVDERLGTPLSVGDLAAYLGVSPRTLARRFAQRLGTSPGAWLLSRRVAAARTLLEETDLPVEAIAARVGLASAVNLRRRFRAQLGTTPGAYRQAFRGSGGDQREVRPSQVRPSRGGRPASTP